MLGWWGHVDFLRGAEEEAYRQLTAPDGWIPYLDTESTLRALRDRGLRIGLCQGQRFLAKDGLPGRGGCDRLLAVQ